MPKGTIGALCACPVLPNSVSNSQCNTTLNLACYISTTDAANCAVGAAGLGTVYTTTTCNCSVYSTSPTVTSSTYNRCISIIHFLFKKFIYFFKFYMFNNNNRCDCKDSTYYWDG